MPQQPQQQAQSERQKPALCLVSVDATEQELVDLFSMLTGRQPTEEELVEMREAVMEEDSPAA